MTSDTSEEAGPATYAVAVDLVVLTIREGALHVLTIRRGVPPHRGELALPGGFVLPSEDLVDAAVRELHEETGLGADAVHLEQLATYGAPDRDPRQRVVSVAYLALAPELPEPAAGSDAAEAMWLPVGEAVDTGLAFDHGTILADGLERARSKIEYTTLATQFCPDEFTIAELRAVYEAVWGRPIDARNFHRKVQASRGYVSAVGRSTTRGGGRPAELYRAGDSEWISPPMTR